MSSSHRFNQIIDKGKEYERKLSAKRNEKQEKDIEECTFKPKIIEDIGQRTIEVHSHLYDRGLALWKSRQEQNRSTEDVEYDKAKSECSIRPNITRLANGSQIATSSAYNSAASKRESIPFDSQAQSKGQVTLERDKRKVSSGK